MNTNKTSGLQIAVLGSAVVMYAGILGYLHYEGLNNPSLARQGAAINQQLQSDLQQRSLEATQASSTSDRPVDPDQRIVRPRNGGIFDTAAPTDDPIAVANETVNNARATTQSSSSAPSEEIQANEATDSAMASSSAAVLPANATMVPVSYTYTSTWRDVDSLGYGQDFSGQGNQNLAAYQGYRNYGDGRGRGNGTGTGNGEGEFSFSMRFASRLRGDSDITADSDWNADGRSWQDWRQSHYWQHDPAAQVYYSSFSSYR